MKKIFLFLFFLMSLLSFLQSASAEVSLQQLNLKDSTVKFSLQNNFLDINGIFTSYQGHIVLNNKNLEEIHLKLNISKIKLDDEENIQSLPLIELLKTLPNPIIIFESKKITPLGKNLFQVHGKLNNGNKIWETNFKINLKPINMKKTEFAFKSASKLDILPTAIPLISNSKDNQGGLSGKLVFSSL